MVVDSSSKFSPLIGITLSPTDLIRILLFFTAVLILGRALLNSKVADSFNLGKLVVALNTLVGNVMITEPAFNPLA